MKTDKIKLLENTKEAEQEKRHYLESLDNLNAGLKMALDLIKSKEESQLTKAEIEGLAANPEHFLTDRLTSKVKIEGMKLSSERILQLQDINLQPILKYFANGRKAKEVAVLQKDRFEIPEQAMNDIIERFTVYTESEQEYQIAEACQKLTDAFDYLQSLVGVRLNYLGLATATNGAINTFHGERCFKPDSLKSLALNVIKEKTI